MKIFLFCIVTSGPKSFQYQLTFTEIFADISAYQGEFTEFTIWGKIRKNEEFEKLWTQVLIECNHWWCAALAKVQEASCTS